MTEADWEDRYAALVYATSIARNVLGEEYAKHNHDPERACAACGRSWPCETRLATERAYLMLGDGLDPRLTAEAIGKRWNTIRVTTGAEVEPNHEDRVLGTCNAKGHQSLYQSGKPWLHAETSTCEGWHPSL